MEKNDDYVTIIRNGKECLVYDWSKNYTKNRFETMVEEWLGTGQGFVRNSATNEWFLIDADERVITCIKSEEVLRFMKEYVYLYRKGAENIYNNCKPCSFFGTFYRLKYFNIHFVTSNYILFKKIYSNNRSLSLPFRY